DWGWRELLLPQALRGMAQQFAVAPIVTLTLGSLAPERLRLASGLFNLMRNLGGAIGIAACATLINDRTHLHFFRLAEHLNSTNEAMNTLVENVTRNFISAGYDAIGAHAAALRQLATLTLREALTQTFSDTFFVIMVCFVVALLVVPL